MKVKLDFVKREIAGESFLVPTGEAAARYCGMFALNEIAALIWDLLPDAKSEDEIVDRILDEYEVSREQASADVSAFLAKLKEMEILG